MRIIGLLTVTVLVLCVFTYFTRQHYSGKVNELQPGGGSDAQMYASAIRAARGAVQNSEAGRRKQFVLEIRLADAIGPAENPVYNVRGADSEILAVTSDSMDNGRCDRLADGEHGAEAQSIGFTGLICRNRNNGAEYTVSLERDR